LKSPTATSSGLRRALAAAAAGLLASAHAEAQDTSADVPTTTVDSALLIYHEVNRVQAIEPEMNVRHQIDEDSAFNFGITADSLTGATPLGAVPSSQSQTYIRPYKVIPLGTPVTVTTASGGSTVSLVPPATGAKTRTLATVLNLGAGLDTRPYRLALPATLRWVELDFPSIIDLKNTKLAGSVPSCHVERVAVDLLDRSARNTVIARHTADSKRTLFITEGVLPYLSVHDASVLATELHSRGSHRSWIQDFDNAGKRRLPRGWDAKLAAAPFLFEVEDWFEFFERYGWRASRVITNFDESQRIKRSYPLDFPFGLILRALPRAMREKILSLSGAVLMQPVRAPSTTSP